MRIILNGVKELEINNNAIKIDCKKKNWVSLDVIYCGVCRSDAKLWELGHRDLILPRVPGHEIVAKYNEQYYAIWPGIACGECENCVNDRENICSKIKILGFNEDGGFAKRVNAPKTSLIPIPLEMPLSTACFAEPIGCIINAIKKLELQKESNILIYGAGTIGLLAAIVSLYYGMFPTLIEKNPIKIKKAQKIAKKASFDILKEISIGEFDYALNACNDPNALIDCFLKVKKGGSIIHFSGLAEGVQIDSKILNLIHYKEINLKGAYGLTPKDMRIALEIINERQTQVELLIEKIILPWEIERVLQSVAKGEDYKYILKCT